MVDRLFFFSELTPAAIKEKSEDKWFDRKSAQITPSQLAALISAFANAEGGDIIIGVSDKKRDFEGINSLPTEKLNHLISAPKDCCRPTPAYEYAFIDIVNTRSEKDRLLVLHIKPEPERLIATQNDSVYLRIGDRTREMKGEDLRMLEYSKDLRHYEDEVHPQATLADLDEALLSTYKERLGASHLSNEEVLTARGFMIQRDGEKRLTNGAALLFAANTHSLCPHCRLRFTRYEGKERGVGVNLNIVKDVNFDFPIPRLIVKATEFISHVLREFTSLNPATSLFETTPEYPEFAWTELLVNAVTHREYAMEGAFIQVDMFDDRLEVVSPGGLPNVVTVENIQHTRFSRNRRIARAMSDLGWVRELNEGVRRIFAEMRASFLKVPQFTEQKNSFVKAVLYNNADVRTLRSRINAVHAVSFDVWQQLDELEKEILVFLSNNNGASTKELVEHTGRTAPTLQKRLKNLYKLEAVISRGSSSQDPRKRHFLKSLLTASE